MHETYHTGSDLSTVKSRFSSNRLVRAQLYTKTDGCSVRQCRVLQRSSVAEALEDRVPDQARPTRRARQQATRPAGPRCATAVKIFTKIETITKNKQRTSAVI